ALPLPLILSLALVAALVIALEDLFTHSVHRGLLSIGSVVILTSSGGLKGQGLCHGKARKTRLFAKRASLSRDLERERAKETSGGLGKAAHRFGAVAGERPPRQVPGVRHRHVADAPLDRRDA